MNLNLILVNVIKVDMALWALVSIMALGHLLALILPPLCSLLYYLPPDVATGE